jgi:hypothetical protein
MAYERGKALAVSMIRQAQQVARIAEEAFADRRVDGAEYSMLGLASAGFGFAILQLIKTVPHDDVEEMFDVFRDGEITFRMPDEGFPQLSEHHE